MILGTLTLLCMGILILVCGIKLWNLFNQGTKYPWQWILITFSLGLLAFAGLFQVYLINSYSSIQYDYLDSDRLESQAYFTFGSIMMLLTFMLSVAEVLMAVGIIASNELSGPREDDRDKKGFLSRSRKE